MIQIKKEYYPNGNLRAEYQINENGLLHGTVKKFHNDGTPVKYIEYKNGIIHGKWISWFTNGMLCYEYNYINGVMGKINCTWYISGIRSSIAQCKLNNIQGIMVLFILEKESLQ